MRGIDVENEGYQCLLALSVLCRVHYGYFEIGRSELSHHVVVVQRGNLSCVEP
jgi:hypothetical protein